MAVGAKPLQTKPSRTRRTHTKSRRGCGNCKIRRVKCDEKQPKCKNCIAYGVKCDFESASADSRQVSRPGNMSSSPLDQNSNTQFESVLSIHEGPAISIIPETILINELHSSDLEILKKFQTRTIMTMGSTSSTYHYRQHFLRLATMKPYLLHQVLTLTLMHERHLYGGLSPEHATAEAFHCYHGTALMNDLLSKPIKDSDKDALWASAVLVGIIAFASVHASDPEESWPLAPASIEDLKWLKISDGKKAVFRIANPYRSDSVFHPLTPELESNKRFIAHDGIDLSILPYGFVESYDLNDTSTQVDSPYYGPILVLSRLMTITVSHDTILKFLIFPSYVNPEYKRLLELKEPRAMVILAWWFTIMMPYRQWWVHNRVKIECQSICLYLERFHPQEVDLQKLLQQPRESCGLAERTSGILRT